MAKNDSIADIKESELVQRLIDDPHWRSDILGLQGMPDRPQILRGALLSGAPGSFEGDADLILFESGKPEIATAIEVKRIKIQASTFESGKPNKLREYPKAVEQANRLVAVGFAQVYLYIFVVVDSRTNNNGECTYDGLTPDLSAKVQACISLENLEPQIGLVVHEFVQPMDHPPLTTGTYGGHLHRLATCVPQAPGIAAWITSMENK
jgi:hypothetical protein